MAKLKHKQQDKVEIFIKAGVYPYLVGPTGSGKTTIAQNVADNLGLKFYYASGVDSEYKLKGFMDSHGRPISTPFIEAYKNGGVFLFDEIDASDPQAIVTAHAALDNGILDTPGGMIKKHPDFHYIAAANTYGHGATLEYIGRSPLDGATLSRYAFLPIEYDQQLERAIVIATSGPEYTSWVDVVQTARKAAEKLELQHIISPRDSYNGAALLKAGLSKTEVFNATILKGLDEDTATQLKEKMQKISKKDLEDLNSSEVDHEDITATLQRLDGSLTELRDAENLVISMKEVKTLLPEFTATAALVKTIQEGAQNAEATLQKLEQLTQAFEESTGFKKSVLNLMVGKKEKKKKVKAQP